jgi:hypothetical protein
MLHREADMIKWKQEQISYFKKYMKSFKKGTKEYTILQNGVEELEGSL